MKNPILINVAECTLASAIAFILVPIFMIGNSPIDFQFIDFAVLAKTGAVFFTLFALVLGLICVVLHLVRLPSLGRGLALFLVVWTLFAGFFLPVSTSTGLVDPKDNPIDFLNLSIVVSSSLLIALLGLTEARKFVYVFVGVAIFTTLIPAIYSIYASNIWRSEPAGRHASLDISNEKNILVISFDGLPGHLVKEIFQSNEKYADAFKDFTVFDNVISQSPSTAGSMIGEIFGIQDYKSKGENLTEVFQTLGNEGAINDLPINRSDDGYMWNYSRAANNDMKIPNGWRYLQDQQETFDFYRYPIVRIWTHFPISISDWSLTTKGARQWAITPTDKTNPMAKLENHKGPKWDQKYVAHIEAYKSFVNGIALSDKKFSARYLHFLFTHFPVDFDAACIYRSDDLAWHEANQNVDGLLRQIECTLDQFLVLTQKLKALGVYDKSLIVFKSDHGEPSDYYSEPPYNVRINNRHRWGYSRYRPTLMIKDFANNQPAIKYHKSLVLLNDLARTLCKKYPSPEKCNRYAGVDLLGKNPEEDTPYYLYVAKGDESDFSYKTHKSVYVPSRRVSLLDVMRQSEMIELITPGEARPKTGKPRLAEINFERRAADLVSVKGALEAFYRKNQSYPRSVGWAGVHSDFGQSSPDYIAGLVPEYLDQLPRDPRGTDSGTENYLYNSDGKNYKFLVHGAPSYDLMRIEPELVDVVRKTHAYGIWTEGAKNW